MSNIVRLGSIEYHFDIHSKFTIIRGASGIGKTTLLKLLDRPDLQVDSKYEFMRMPKRMRGNSWEQQLKSYEHSKDTVFYMDEDFPDLENMDFQRAMVATNVKFMIVVRDLLSHIPYGIQDVYTVVRSDKGKRHDVVQLYVPQSIVDWLRFETLMTEDSKSGYYFFSSFLKSVRSAGGKSNILKEWKKRLRTVFVVDGVGFGAEIGRIVEEIGRNSHNALWVMDSFEAMILHSDFIASDKEPDMFEDNQEVFYEKALQARMQAEGQVYSKRSVCKCLVFDCCYKDKCRLNKRGIKPKLILGPVYEKLEVFGLRTAAERVQQVKGIEHALV